MQNIKSLTSIICLVLLIVVVSISAYASSENSFTENDEDSLDTMCMSY